MIGLMSFIQDTWFIFRRQVRLVLRNPAFLTIGLLQPILYLVLFGPLLATCPRARSPAARHRRRRERVPVLRAWAADPAGAVRLDVRRVRDHLRLAVGVIERYRVTPVSRVAILAGRVLRDVTMLIVQSIVLILAGLAFGLRAPLPALLMGFVYIVLVAIGLASVSYAVALRLKSEDAFAPLINSIIVPLVLLSGIMLPLTSGRAGCRASRGSARSGTSSTPCARRTSGTTSIRSWSRGWRGHRAGGRVHVAGSRVFVRENA